MKLNALHKLCLILKNKFFKFKKYEISVCNLLLAVSCWANHLMPEQNRVEFVFKNMSLLHLKLKKEG